VAPAESTVRGAVLFVQLEETIDEAQRKYQWILNGMGLRRDPRTIQDLLIEYIVAQPFKLDGAGRLDEIKRIIGELKPDLVVWDSLRRMIHGDSNSDEFAERFVWMLDQLQAEYPSAHGVTAHWRKKSSEKELNEPGERVRGSSAIIDQVDVHLAMERDKVNDFATMTHDKNRMGLELAPFNFRVRIADREGMAALEYIGAADSVSQAGCGAAVVSLLKSQPGKIWRRPEIVTAISDFTEKQVKYAIAALERSRILSVEQSQGNRATLVALRGALSEQTEMASTGQTGHDRTNLECPTTTPYKDDD
jgi:hypothetical protein